MDNIELLNRIKRRVIVAILADDELGNHLVLKGGNLLQFAYQLTARASKDIDISIDGDLLDKIKIENRVKVCLETAFAEMKLVVFDFQFDEVPERISEDLKSFWGGYKCEFKLIDQGKYQAHVDNPEPDFVSVQQTVSPGFRLREFAYYFEFVRDRCEQLKTLWHE